MCVPSLQNMRNEAWAKWLLAETFANAFLKDFFYLVSIIIDRCNHLTEYGFLWHYFWFMSSIFITSLQESLLFQMENSGVVHMLKNNKTEGMFVLWLCMMSSFFIIGCYVSKSVSSSTDILASQGLALLTLSWDKNWDSHSLVNGYPRFYPRIALVAPSPDWPIIQYSHDIACVAKLSTSLRTKCNKTFLSVKELYV